MRFALKLAPAVLNAVAVAYLILALLEWLR